MLIAIVAIVMRANLKQRKRLIELETAPKEINERGRFVTHFGVWWKIFPDAEFIEDMPYCACCDERRKLVQTEWHPDEIFKCPKTSVEHKIFDGVPRKREDILVGLYRSYFHSINQQFEQRFLGELNAHRELHPGISDEELRRKLFSEAPLNRIPEFMLDEIFSKYPAPHAAFGFISRNFRLYKKYFKQSDDA